MITFVTAFFTPSSDYRTSETYFSMFENLAATNLPIILFLDEKLIGQAERFRKAYPNVQIEPSTLDKSWLPPTEFVLPEKRNEKKDTVDYFFIQLSKLRHLSRASEMVTTSHLAWVDFGIFHMFPNVSRAQQLLQEISTMELPLNKVFSPSCWVYESSFPKFVRESTLWFHCGSFMVGDKTLFPDFYRRQNEIVAKNLPSLTWEVNYWAMMDGFTPYRADHNETILSGLIKHQSKNTETVMTKMANHERTDKNTIHSYLPVYEKLFHSKRETAKNVVEIGIGICPKGGGSIKLWHDYFPNAHVYGMDVQSLHMFWDELKNKERITLYTDVNSYDDEFVEKHFFQHKLDIIIDDGDHQLESMIRFIALYSQSLAEGGVMVIEDIQDIKWVDTLRRFVPKHLKPYIEIYDLRSEKGRYDDIMFVINTNKTL